MGQRHSNMAAWDRPPATLRKHRKKLSRNGKRHIIRVYCLIRCNSPITDQRAVVHEIQTIMRRYWHFKPEKQKPKQELLWLHPIAMFIRATEDPRYWDCWVEVMHDRDYWSRECEALWTEYGHQNQHWLVIEGRDAYTMRAPPHVAGPPELTAPPSPFSDNLEASADLLVGEPERRVTTPANRPPSPGEGRVYNRPPAPQQQRRRPDNRAPPPQPQRRPNNRAPAPQQQRRQQPAPEDDAEGPEYFDEDKATVVSSEASE